MREVELANAARADPDAADFDATVFAGGDGLMVRMLAVAGAEMLGDGLQQGGLIGLDGEVIVGVALIDQIVGERVLGMQGVGGQIAVAQVVDGIEQRDDGADFVGLFIAFAIGPGQGANFFSVRQVPD